MPKNISSHNQSGGITAHTVNLVASRADESAHIPPPKTSRKSRWKLWAVFSSVLTVVASVIGILDPFGLIPGRGKVSDKPNVSVTSHNQSGGITAGTVNINAAPEPKLNAQVLLENQQSGSEFLSRYALTIDSPYPPANLYIVVSAPTIKRIDLVPQRSGMVIGGHSGVRPGMAFTNLQNPYGLLHLNVITSQPEKLSIEWDLH